MEYADDTVLMGVTTQQLQSFLHAIQEASSHYGMFLNTEKTYLLVHPDHPADNLFFLDGTPVPQREEVTH